MQWAWNAPRTAALSGGRNTQPASARARHDHRAGEAHIPRQSFSRGNASAGAGARVQNSDVGGRRVKSRAEPHSPTQRRRQANADPQGPRYSCVPYGVRLPSLDLCDAPHYSIARAGLSILALRRVIGAYRAIRPLRGAGKQRPMCRRLRGRCRSRPAPGRAGRGRSRRCSPSRSSSRITLRGWAARCRNSRR